MSIATSTFAIFDKPEHTTEVLNYTIVDYYPLSSVSSGGPIEFHVPGSAEEYIDVNDINLYIKFKVTKADGKAIVATDKVGLVNNGIATLFQDVSLTVGETQIEGGQNCYPYLGYFNSVMQYSPEAQTSHMRAMGWYRDEAGKFDAEANSGFKRRSALIEGSKSAEIMGPLFLNFFRQEKYLISQTDMRIKFMPSKPDFALNAFGTTDFKIQFEEVILYVPRAELNPSIINGHAAGLRTQNAIYPINHSEVMTFTIPKGQKSYVKDRLFPDGAPKLLLVAMIDNEAYNGNIKKNPFNFQHFDLNKIALYKDGRSTPGRPLTPDFDKDMYLRDYLMTMRAFNYPNSDDTNGFTPQMFANGFTIYAYDLTSTRDVSSALQQPSMSKNLRLELYFEKDLPSTVNVLLYAVSDSNVQITRLRDVIPAYNR